MKSASNRYVKATMLSLFVACSVLLQGCNPVALLQIVGSLVMGLAQSIENPALRTLATGAGQGLAFSGGNFDQFLQQTAGSIVNQTAGPLLPPGVPNPYPQGGYPYPGPPTGVPGAQNADAFELLRRATYVAGGDPRQIQPQMVQQLAVDFYTRQGMQGAQLQQAVTIVVPQVMQLRDQQLASAGPQPGQVPQLPPGQFPVPNPGQFPVPNPGQFPVPNPGQFPVPNPGQFPGPIVWPPANYPGTPPFVPPTNQNPFPWQLPPVTQQPGGPFQYPVPTGQYPQPYPVDPRTQLPPGVQYPPPPPTGNGGSRGGVNIDVGFQLPIGNNVRIGGQASIPIRF